MQSRYEELIIAAGELIDAIHPNFSGDMINGLRAMTKVVAELDDADPTIMDLCAALDATPE